MDNRTLIKNFPVKNTLTGTEIIPGMTSSEDEATGMTVRHLKSLGITVSSSSTPTVNDDVTNGFWNKWLWFQESTEHVYLLTNNTSGAATWVRLGNVNISGLTNPLTSDITGSGHIISNIVFRGFKDVYYDLSNDVENLIAGGVATLIRNHSAYVFSGITTDLTIRLPPLIGSSNDFAPFGMISLLINDTGSVTISQDVPYLWNTGESLSGYEELPKGVPISIYYRWDAIAEAHILTKTFLHTSTPPGVSYVQNSVRKTNNVTASDVNTHSLVYDFTSEIQDGSVYVLLAFNSSGTAAPSAIPEGAVAINTPPTGEGTQPQNRWYYYKPTQADLDGEFKEFTWTKASSRAQIAAFEVSGADPDNPIGDTANNRSTNANRTSIASVELETELPYSLLVSCAAKHAGGSGMRTVTVNSSNGFSTLIAQTHNGNGIPLYVINIMSAKTAYTYDTPSYTANASGPTQLEAFVIKPRGS